MTVIGLTGSFGTGKTFVASIFRSLGAKVLDADKIAHDVIKKRQPAYKKIVAAFGDSALAKNGEIDRKKLAGIVFEDTRKLNKLNSIVHPEVVNFIKSRIRKAGKGEIIVIDAPLLVEVNLAKITDSLVVVKASKAIQVERCIRKFCMEREDVLKRIRHEIPMKKKIRMADFVIDNDGTPSETRKQARKVWREIVWK